MQRKRSEHHSGGRLRRAWSWFARRFRAQTKREVVAVDDPRLLEILGIDPDDFGVRGAGALREATVYACVKILSEAVAKLPLKVYQERPEGGIRKANDHYLYPLLKHRPNPYMTAYDFWRAVEAQRALRGNSFVAIEFETREPNKGIVKALWPIDASKVEVWVDDEGLISSRNRIWYIVTVGGERRRLDPEQVLHFKGLTVDGIFGINPIDYLRFLVESGAGATRYLHHFYKHGLQTRGIVHYVGDLNENAKRQFREKFEQMASGLKNAHRISLLPVGFQFQPLQLSMTDAQFLENTQLTIRQIANVFGIKMHQLNDLSRATHTNIEEQQKQFYADTLQAILTGYEQEIAAKLLLESELRDGYYVKWNVDSIVRSDIKTRYEAYRVGIQGGFLTPNEVRALEELPAHDGGDMLLVNGAMRLLDDVVEGRR